MDELQKIQQQIEDLQKKAKEIAQANRLPALEDVKNKIQLYSFTAEELGFKKKTRAKSNPVSMGEKIKKAVAIKYKLGNDTWTGRGRKPKWVEKHLASGKSLDEIAI